MYRPNAAKVKNLKTKDYLGRARLISASDRSNTFTGFAGSENKKAVLQTAKDDRPDEKLSYAATNLVKPELQGRTRQQSEPPLNRNMFPPTPPPETDRKSVGKSDAQITRAQSVRGGGSTPQPLNLGRAALDQLQESSGPAPHRPQRSASARPSERLVERAPSTRVESTRTRHREYRSRRRGSNDDIDEYYADNSYERPIRSSRGVYAHPKPVRRPEYIVEEEEDDYDGSDVDDAEFEMISRAKSRRRSPAQSTRSGCNNRGVGGKIRVKCHATDTRYVFITPDTTIREFWQLIREKFGVRGNFKVEIKDDGDMITMADQDDLDMAVQSAKEIVRKEGSNMAKMEVSSPRQPTDITVHHADTQHIGLGSRCIEMRYPASYISTIFIAISLLTHILGIFLTIRFVIRVHASMKSCAYYILQLIQRAYWIHPFCQNILFSHSWTVGLPWTLFFSIWVGGGNPPVGLYVHTRRVYRSGTHDSVFGCGMYSA